LRAVNEACHGDLSRRSQGEAGSGLGREARLTGGLRRTSPGQAAVCRF